VSVVGHPSQQVYFSRIVAHYSVILPDTMRTYVEPDIEVLAEYSLNESEEVYTVARLLLQGVLERAKPSRRVEMAKKASAFYTTRDQSEVRVINNPSPAAHSHHHSRPGLSASAFDSVSSASALSGGGGGGGVGLSLNTSAGGGGAMLSADTPVSDKELMTALVLCLIGVFDSGRKDREEKKRQKAEETLRHQQQAIAKEEGEEVVEYLEGDKIHAAASTPEKKSGAGSGAGAGAGAGASPATPKGGTAAAAAAKASSADPEQEREGLDEHQELEQEKIRIRKDFEQLKKDNSEFGQALDAIEAVSVYVTNTLLRVLNVVCAFLYYIYISISICLSIARCMMCLSVLTGVWCALWCGVVW
jgi:hypothetical protein